LIRGDGVRRKIARGVIGKEEGGGESEEEEEPPFIPLDLDKEERGPIASCQIGQLSHDEVVISPTRPGPIPSAHSISSSQSTPPERANLM
jgi:hypothetical protein